MGEIEALKKDLGEVIKAVKTIAERLEKLEKQATESNGRSNDNTLTFRGNVIKFKDSGYNNGSAMFIIETPKKGQSITIAITAEEWEKLKELGDRYFYGNNSNGKSYKKKSSNRSYNNKNGFSRSYSKKNYSKSYSKLKKKSADLEVEEASYDDALE